MQTIEEIEQILDPDSYPLWRYQLVTLLPEIQTQRVEFRTSQAIDYLVQKIFVEYQTTGPAPVTFQDPSFILVDNSRGKKFGDAAVPFTVMSSPTRYDNLGSGNNPRLNQQVLNAKSIDWTFYNTSVIELEIKDFQGIGKPTTIGIHIQGRAYFKKN